MVLIADAAVNVFIAGLAGAQLTEVMNHSTIALPIRKWALEAARKSGLRGFFGSLISCAFCFSHWACLFMLMLLSAAAIIACAPSWSAWSVLALRLVPFTFAAVRIANLSNDVLYAYLRTPKNYVEEPEELENDYDSNSENNDLENSLPD